MFGTKQRIGLANSSLEKAQYEPLETEEDLEKILEGISLLKGEETEESFISKPTCAICENYGILQPNNQNPRIKLSDISIANTFPCEEFSVRGDFYARTLPCEGFPLQGVEIRGVFTGNWVYIKYNLKVLAQCGSELENGVTCNCCSRTDAIKNQRKSAKNGLAKQAERMLALSRQKLPPTEVGQNVIVKVPNADRGRLAPRNVLAVVVSVNESSLYQLGTKEETLDRLYCRNEFAFADSQFTNQSNVSCSLLNLRKALALPFGSKQRFVCVTASVTKKCKCQLKDVLCNSKCSNGSSCKNK
ncbi:hypothetical protein ILUMI_00053 [Ignelater luminosus]|uniref:Uncharacterized protein n=1 Tax=Ignelater luminosus TaxID=2038154 RepID=A0A8K0DL93_IGNLU|nr:hypothetical protein ILUMI_00053 [Ignelater luminosus]